jgi:hypothetical protein
MKFINTKIMMKRIMLIFIILPFSQELKFRASTPIKTPKSGTSE